jgi:hypothetical protein
VALEHIRRIDGFADFAEAGRTAVQDDVMRTAILRAVDKGENDAEAGQKHKRALGINRRPGR